MTVAALFDSSIRRMMSNGGKRASAETRAAARHVFDNGGAAAKDVLGLGVGKVHPAKVARKAKPKALPVERRVLANQEAGHRRENAVAKMLRLLFPRNENYHVYREQYLRTKDGKIALDKRTHESRRIDFLVFRGRKPVRSLEVTSERVDKAAQLRKEADIRGAGGGYLLDPETHKLVKFPASLKTRVVRLP